MMNPAQQQIVAQWNQHLQTVEYLVMPKGTKNKDLKRAADGSLTIHVQAEAPSAQPPSARPAHSIRDPARSRRHRSWP